MTTNPFAAFIGAPAPTPQEEQPGLEDTTPPPPPAPEPPAAPAPEPAPQPQEEQPGRPKFRAPDTRRRLNAKEVENIRHAWKYARDLSEGRLNEFDSTSDWETVTETERRLADQFGVTVTSLRSIVRGTSYRGAGGPIDTERAERHAMYQQLKETKGIDYARRYMAKFRTGEGTGNAKPVLLEVTISLDGKSVTLHLDPSAVVTMTTVTDMGHALVDLAELDAWVTSQVE